MFVLLCIPLFSAIAYHESFPNGAIHEWLLKNFCAFSISKILILIPFWFVRLGSSMPFPWTGSTRRWQPRQKETGYYYWRHLRMCFWLSDVWGLRPQKWLTPGLREPLSRLNTNPGLKMLEQKIHGLSRYIVWFSGFLDPRKHSFKVGNFDGFSRQLSLRQDLPNLNNTVELALDRET